MWKQDLNVSPRLHAAKWIVDHHLYKGNIFVQICTLDMYPQWSSSLTRKSVRCLRRKFQATSIWRNLFLNSGLDYQIGFFLENSHNFQLRTQKHNFVSFGKTSYYMSNENLNVPPRSSKIKCCPTALQTFLSFSFSDIMS